MERHISQVARFIHRDPTGRLVAAWRLSKQAERVMSICSGYRPVGSSVADIRACVGQT
jgi:hypothetical protein